MQRRTLLISALVALPLIAGGGAFALASGTGTTSPATTFIADVAGQLGISSSTLTSAIQKAEIDQVQSLVSAGKLSSSRAAKIEANIQSGKLGPRFGMLPPHRMHGRRGLRVAMQAARGYLGMTRPQLMAQFQAGKSLAQIATVSGKSVQGLESAITTAMQNDLNKAVTAGKLTQTRQQKMLSHLQTFVQNLVNRTGPGRGMRGGPPNGPQGGSGQGTSWGGMDGGPPPAPGV